MTEVYKTIDFLFKKQSNQQSINKRKVYIIMSEVKVTPGQQLKARWHKEGQGMSLKQFARKLVAEGDKVAETWFEHKKGILNKGRTDTKKALITQQKLASKNARRK